MTTVIFKRTSDGISYLSDSQSTSDYGEIARTDKVFRIGHHVIGMSGSDMVKCLLSTIKLHELDSCHNPESHLTNCILRALRSYYNDMYPPIGHLGSPSFNILVSHDKVDTFYKVSDHFGIVDSSKEFLSIGSGGRFALDHYQSNPTARPIEHLKYAAQKDSYTSSPFIVY